MSIVAVTIDGHTFVVNVRMNEPSAPEFTVEVDGETLNVRVPDLDEPSYKMEWMIVGSRPYEIVLDRELHWIKAYRGLHRLEARDLEAGVARPISGDSRVKAPIPGTITRVLVAPGDHVEPGQTVLLLEAMKMENEVRAPRAGTVAKLNVSPGQDVTLGAVLAEIN